MANGIDIEYESDGAAVIAWGQVVVIAVFSRADVEVFRATLSAAQRLSARGKACSLAVVKSGASLPLTPAEEASFEAEADGYLACSARVLPAYGPWERGMRDTLQRIDQASGKKRPRGTFSRIETASEWLAQSMGQDHLWQSQLTTLAGTLLYGTPSWTRPSQRSDLLCGEADGTDIYVDQIK